MKKSIATVIAVFTVLALAACATARGGVAVIYTISLGEAISQSAEKIATRLPPKSRVLIVAFDSPNEGLSHYIMEELTGALISLDIEVADRKNLEYLYKELNFPMLADMSDESAQPTGKFLDVQFFISGVLTDIGEAYRFRTSTVQMETATFVSVPRFDVRKDNAMRDMVTSFAKQKTETRTARYGVSEQTVPQTIGNFLDRGIMFAMRKDYDPAIEDFTQAIRINPNLTGAFILRGKALFEEKDNNRAAEDFSEAIRLEPDNAVANNERGMVWHQSAEYDRALEDFSKAIQLNPDFAAAYARRGDTYNIRKEFSYAIEDYTSAIRINPGNKYTYMKRAWVYQFQGDYDLSIADYTSAIELDPNFIKAYMERGATYREREEDLELTTDSYKPNYDRAIADFTRVIKVEPNNADAYSERALTYTSKKDYNRAIADFNRAIQIEPNNRLFYKYRGDTYMGKKDYNRAIEDYEASLRIDPGDITIQRSIQRARQELGK